jgi:hypothetical protein
METNEKRNESTGTILGAISMNISLTEPVPEEDAPPTTTTPVIEVPERLTEAQRKVVDHMARLHRRGKPYIMVISFDGSNTAIHGCNERLGFVTG